MAAEFVRFDRAEGGEADIAQLDGLLKSAQFSQRKADGQVRCAHPALLSVRTLALASRPHRPVVPGGALLARLRVVFTAAQANSISPVPLAHFLHTATLASLENADWLALVRRWAVLNAVHLLRRHLDVHEKLVAAMDRGASVGECFCVIETELADNSDV